MKKLIQPLTLLCTLALATNAFAQDDEQGEPISAEDDESLDDVPQVLDNGITGSVSLIGSILSGDPCAGLNIAEKAYCYPAKWLAGILPCTYGKNTPQATLCEDEPVPSKGSNRDYEGSRVINDGFELNPDYKPVRAENAELRKHLLTHLNKKKKGEVVHRWKDGSKLVLRSRIVNPKKSSDVMFVFEIVNTKGRATGRPVYYFKGGTLYINDLSRRK